MPEEANTRCSIEAHQRLLTSAWELSDELLQGVTGRCRVLIGRGREIVLCPCLDDNMSLTNLTKERHSGGIDHILC